MISKRAFYLIVTFVFFCGLSVSAQGVYFDDSHPDLMLLGSDDGYEVAFLKSNGGIFHIIDKTTGTKVILGSKNMSLWRAEFLSGVAGSIGGSNYRSDWGNRFIYKWDEVLKKITFNYEPDPLILGSLAVTVEITAYESTWFDMRIEVENRKAGLLEYMHFPADLLFTEDDLVEMLLPALPGLILERSFFIQNRSYTRKYPAWPGMFADFASIKFNNGSVSIYTVRDEKTFSPIVLGTVHDLNVSSDRSYYYHAFGLRLKDGETWKSHRVRINVGGEHPDYIEDYRISNEIDKYVSIKDKLGDKYKKVVQSPLIKLNAQLIDLPFLSYADSVLAFLPVPSLIHPVAFQMNGFDENTPDFLPPDPRYGTTQELAQMFRDAQARGHLVMPYLNLTWWDDDSPTLRNLPALLSIEDIAVIQIDQNPVYVHYKNRGGYVMSPFPQFVMERVDQLIQQMTYEVPSDLFFEDQIGARQWLFDHNTSSPSVTSYINGWIDHTRKYSEMLLMTEMGFDMLAETETGFHGSLLLLKKTWEGAYFWGDKNWHTYPMAAMLFRDKVLLYQHDLAPESMTTDKYILSWNLANGYVLSYEPDWKDMDRYWLRFVGEVQKYVISRYTDERMMEFTKEDSLTISRFETHTVVTNRNSNVAVSVGEHQLSPSGFSVTSGDGKFIAGLFDSYRGYALEGSDHCIIEAENYGYIFIRHPYGADTEIRIPMLEDWEDAKEIIAAAHGIDNMFISLVPLTVSDDYVTLILKREVQEKEVGFYKIIPIYSPKDRDNYENARFRPEYPY